MVNKHMKRCSASSSIRDMQIKLQWDVTAHLSELLKWKIVIMSNAGRQEKLYDAFMDGGNVKWCGRAGKEHGSF